MCVLLVTVTSIVCVCCDDIVGKKLNGWVCDGVCVCVFMVVLKLLFWCGFNREQKVTGMLNAS